MQQFGGKILIRKKKHRGKGFKSASFNVLIQLGPHTTSQFRSSQETLAIVREGSWGRVRDLNQNSQYLHQITYCIGDFAGSHNNLLKWFRSNVYAWYVLIGLLLYRFSSQENSQTHFHLKPKSVSYGNLGTIIKSLNWANMCLSSLNLANMCLSCSHMQSTYSKEDMGFSEKGSLWFAFFCILFSKDLLVSHPLCKGYTFILVFKVTFAFEIRTPKYPLCSSMKNILSFDNQINSLQVPY